MRALILSVAVFGALAGSACAQAPGWTPAELKDLRGTAQYHFRSPELDFLSTEGDFDGDGQPDKARLLRNAKDHKYALEVKLANGKSQHLAEGDLSELTKLGVTMVSPGLYSTTCLKGEGAVPCATANVEVQHDAISLFVFEGANRYFHWTGGRFEQAWIVN